MNGSKPGMTPKSGFGDAVVFTRLNVCHLGPCAVKTKPLPGFVANAVQQGNVKHRGDEGLLNLSSMRWRPFRQQKKYEFAASALCFLP